MAGFDLVIRAERMVTPGGQTSGSVGITGGRISAIEPLRARLDAKITVELGSDEVLLPGLVDTHVHVNDPGRAEWEGFDTATRAAAAGGITTVIDMPLNSVPPTTNLAALAAKKAATANRLHVDVGFWGGAVGTNSADLPALHDAGVFGFKCFLLHSGVDEFGHLDEPHLAGVVELLAARDALLIVHAEHAATIDVARPAEGARYATFLASRPRQAENVAIAQMLNLAERFRARIHILHLSSADALPLISAARRRGVRVTAETCPHYLTFCAEEIPDGATEFKCCPPIREAENRERLWQGLRDGVIDFVASDHSPCTVQLKRFDVGDFGLAWGGVSSLQVGMAAVWTQARQRRIPLTDVVRWMARRPAEVVGLNRKGRIELGYDADFSAFAPDAAFVVDPADLHHRNPITPYRGRPLAGVVRRTWLRGAEVTGREPFGRLLRRGET